jgi:hypothetical protein
MVEEDWQRAWQAHQESRTSPPDQQMFEGGYRLATELRSQQLGVFIGPMLTVMGLVAILLERGIANWLRAAGFILLGVLWLRLGLAARRLTSSHALSGMTAQAFYRCLLEVRRDRLRDASVVLPITLVLFAFEFMNRPYAVAVVAVIAVSSLALFIYARRATREVRRELAAQDRDSSDS